MAATPTVELTSRLAAPVGDVRAHMTSMVGVNEELGPWVSMGYPADFARLDLDNVTPGRVLFHCWVRLLRVVPFDRHALRVESFEQHPDGGGGFVEDSTSWLQRTWRHERQLDALGSGCRVTDRVTVVPRMRWSAPLVRIVVPAVFRHRHRRLRQHFGELDDTATTATATAATGVNA